MIPEYFAEERRERLQRRQRWLSPKWLAVACWLMAGAVEASPSLVCKGDRQFCEELTARFRQELAIVGKHLDVEGLAWRWVLLDEGEWRVTARRYEREGVAVSQLTRQMFSVSAMRTTFVRVRQYLDRPGDLRADLVHEHLHIRCYDEEWVKKESRGVLRALNAATVAGKQ